MLRIILIISIIYLLSSVLRDSSEVTNVKRREKRLIETIDPNYDKKVGR